MSNARQLAQGATVPPSFKNKLINGDMRVSQRGGIGFFATNNLYGGCDRWLTSLTGTTVSAVTLQAAYPSMASGYCHQVANVTTTGSTSVAISQRIEAANSLPMNGKTITVSGKVNQQTGAAQTLTVVIYKANAADNFNGGVTLVSSNTVSIPNSTLTPFSFSFNLGATDASNGIQFTLQFATLPALNNIQFYYGDMQLEVGAVATPVEQRPIGLELSLCQRYYWQTGTIGACGVFRTAATLENVSYRCPVIMRTSPSVTLGGTGNGTILVNGSSTGVSSVSGSGTSEFVSLSLNASAAQPQNAAAYWSPSGALVFANAEL